MTDVWRVSNQSNTKASRGDSSDAASDCHRHATTCSQISEATHLEVELTLVVTQCICSGLATCILRNIATQLKVWYVRLLEVRQIPA